MYTLIIPAIVSVLIKLYLTYISRRSFKFGIFTVLLCACMLQSLCEAIGFTYWLLGYEIEFFFRFYYVMAIWCLCFALIYTFQIAKHSNFIPYLFIGLSVLLSFLFIFTDSIISGYVENGHVLNGIKSKYYWLFQAFAFSSMFISIATLTHKIFSSKESILSQIRAFYLLLGLIAPFGVTFSVIILISLGYNINAMAIMPVSTTILFVLLLMSENQHLLTDIKRKFPWSIESKTNTKIEAITSSVLRKEITLKEAQNLYQREIIISQINSTNNNISEIARSLGVSRSNLYQITNRLDIDLKNKK